MESYTQQFMAEIDAYLNASGMSATGFGKAALGDPGFVFEIKNEESPRSPTLKTIERVRKWMAEHPAEDAAA